MTADSATAALTGGVALLERALGYALGSLRLVTPQAMANATPCREWDLHGLLLHTNDSLLALHEAIALGHVGLDPARYGYGGRAGYGRGAALDSVATFRNRACRVIGAWANAREPRAISIADRELTPGLVAATGAVEIAVHGWDVARACGHDYPLPPTLAGELLDLCLLLVSDADRPVRFAAPVEVSPQASPSDRLVAFLGRRPR